MTTELINSLFSDIWTLLLTFIGILLSILTLLYSFILSKRDELKIINEKIRLGDKDPLTLQRKGFSTRYIKKLKSINKDCFTLLILSSISAIFCWLGMRIFNSSKATIWIFYFVAITTVIIICYLLWVTIKVIKQYKTDTVI